MQLGIFAKTFSRPTLEETLDAVIQHDLHCIQFNMTCVGLPSMPEAIDPAVIARIQAEMKSRQITMVAISGTFNMAHPDPQIRRDGLRRLDVLSTVCQAIGTSIITLCTGTRDPKDMWHWHDENTSSAAWHDMLETMSAAVRIAENVGVTLAFEPERANVIYNAHQARELLTCLASPNLKVVLDPANIIDGRNPAAIADVIDEAFDLLGDDIVMAHAKDKDPNDGFCAAGKGVLDYARYLKHLDDMHFEGALIIHSLEEWEVDTSVQFLRNAFQRIVPPAVGSLS
jgi:sugar phosphate isomerase/epimerase